MPFLLCVEGVLFLLQVWLPGSLLERLVNAWLVDIDRGVREEGILEVAANRESRVFTPVERHGVEVKYLGCRCRRGVGELGRCLLHLSCIVSNRGNGHAPFFQCGRGRQQAQTL